MKIVVTTLHSSKGETHQIDVVDGQRILHTQTVDTIEQRDKIVWNLAELYHVVDIDVRNNRSKNIKDDEIEFRYSEIPSIPVMDEDDAATFFDDESKLVFDRIVKAVEEGLLMKLPSIRLFELNGTGQYLTAERLNWKDGLHRALQYYLAEEDYMMCAKIRDLNKQL